MTPPRKAVTSLMDDPIAVYLHQNVNRLLQTKSIKFILDLDI